MLHEVCIHDEAIICHNRSTLYDPQDMEVYRCKGLVLMKFDMISEALDCFEMAVCLDPQNSTYRYGQHAGQSR